MGTPAQYPRVLISTAGYNSWVVMPQPGCNSSTNDCANSRGSLFSPNQSSTWKDRGLYAFDLEQNLNYSTNGDFGFDTVGLGLQPSSGPTLENQVVAGFLNNLDYYLGIFGVAPWPTNLTNFSSPEPSFMTTLRSKNLIPSLTYSYTAGAKYSKPSAVSKDHVCFADQSVLRLGLKQVLGSAVLGGYDRSRFIPNNLTFNFAPDISRDLVVGLQAIGLTDANGKSASLLPSGILTFIDSTIPYIYLPLEACQAFEKELDLVWNASSQLYLVNDTLHKTLQARKLNFTFQLGNLATGGQSVNITFPYDSFALTVGQPLVSNLTRYFPLKRSTNDTQYTLGRAFLQEA